MRQASYALAALFVPFVGWYLLAPVAVLFGWVRRAFMRFCSWIFLLLALLAVFGDIDRGASQRVAWGAGWLAAAAIGFRLSCGLGVYPRVPDRFSRWCRRWAAAVSLRRRNQDPHELIVLCERRIGRPVDVAARLRVKTPSGARTHVLAVAAGYLWWIELHRWRTRVGAILVYRSLHGLAAHTERRRGGRHAVELSWPSNGELFVGTLYGADADRLAGHLAAEQFARARGGGLSQTADRELVWLAGLGALLLALIAGVESAGLAGGLFASGHPVPLSLPDAAATLARLTKHLGVSAWPAADQRWLPQTMTAALALGSLVALALSAAALWAVVRLAGPVGGDGARFARAGDLRPLRMRSGVAHGIPLGYHDGHELAGEPNASVALCGPSQVGKSLAAVVRAILKWDGCLIVLSIKEELLRYTLHAREQRGEVKIFDPTGQTGYRTQAWSPVAASHTWTQARAIASGLLQIGQEADRNDREPHWRRTAARYLAPLLLAANQSGQSMRTVLSWIDLIERDDLRTILKGSSDPEALYALENLESLWKTDARYQGSVLGTLSTALDAWQEPTVAQATTLADITPEWLCEGSNTLYILAPASQQRRLQNLFGGLLVHMIDGALGIAQQAPTGRLSPPLLCALDEICNAAPLPTLGEYASSGAGQGVLLLSVIQDYSQAIDTWGRERAATILSNHRGKLFWSGIADPATFEYVDQLLGREERERQSRTRQAYGGTSTTHAQELRPLAPPHRLRQAKFGAALLVYGQLPPVWTEQRLFFEDRELRKLVPDEVLAAVPASGRESRSALWRWADAG